MACHPEIPCSFAIWARFFLLKSLSVSAVIQSHSKVTHARQQRTHAVDEKVHDSSVSGPIRKTPCIPDKGARHPVKLSRSRLPSHERNPQTGARPKKNGHQPVFRG